ncbi:hypothetical protein KIN20_023916 [Parelaphostrongylus tenuis]|uniref:Uncharacterized protein n=1 Tax=Parelaphostrongylus tenuis TaxID=148309 RepID=A0AAD5MSM8_PARTN|nr:hypothetical protein KIN20_023916 [Parelaphostrongylus tenuis]
MPRLIDSRTWDLLETVPAIRGYSGAPSSLIVRAPLQGNCAGIPVSLLGIPSNHVNKDGTVTEISPRWLTMAVVEQIVPGLSGSSEGYLAEVSASAEFLIVTKSITKQECR